MEECYCEGDGAVLEKLVSVSQALGTATGRAEQQADEIHRILDLANTPRMKAVPGANHLFFIWAFEGPTPPSGHHWQDLSLAERVEIAVLGPLSDVVYDREVECLACDEGCEA